MPPQAHATYQILTIRRAEQVQRWRAPFAQAYVRIFAGEPYNESWTVEQAARHFDRLTSVKGHITLIAVSDDGALAGFGIAIPLRSKPDVARELTGLVPIQHAYYLAELGVLPEHRSQGLGHKLIMERINRIDPAACTHVVLRVALGNHGSRALYEKLGFEDMGVYMEVPNLRTDGTVRADRRLFMARVLSQVDRE